MDLEHPVQQQAWAKIGLFLAAGDGYAPYYREALEHFGLQFECLPDVPQHLYEWHVLALSGYGELKHTDRARLLEWVEQGGSLIVSGSDWGLRTSLGLGEPRHASNEVLVASPSERMWPDGAADCRFLGGVVFPEAKGAPISIRGGAAACARIRVGKGRVFVVGPHVGQTWAQMTLGRSVEIDGIGPSDGSARLDDGILRAEDGSVLDFELDRTTAPDGSRLFGTPYADIVREIWFRAVLEGLEATNTQGIIAWHWPHGSPGTFMVTLDCESFETEPIQRMQRMLSMYGGTAAWIVSQPGYSLDVYRKLRSWEHEIGVLYSTEEGLWLDDRLKMQHVALARSATIPHLTASRPADGRWQGWKAFYEMCEAGGIRLSVSKGGRQPGTSGFLFGTSHPFFPLKRDGSPYFVAEMAYSITMPGRITPDKACDILVAEALARGGCLHICARPEATLDSVAADSLRRVLALCRQSRMACIRPEELYRFEKGRRQLRIVPRGNTIHLSSLEHELEGLTLLVSGDPEHLGVRGKASKAKTVERYGMRFRSIELNLEPKQLVEIDLEGEQSQAA